VSLRHAVGDEAAGVAGGGGILCALRRAVRMDLSGPTENPNLLSCDASAGHLLSR
jgi:hypothetical protein